MLGTLGLGLLQFLLELNDVLETAAPAFVILVSVISFAISLLLTLLISRARSRVAMWIFIVGFIIGFPVLARSLADEALWGPAGISVIQTAVQMVAICLLFTQRARLWMRKADDGSMLRETFS